MKDENVIAEPSPFEDVSDGWSQNLPKSKTCGIIIKFIVDLERNSDANINGLEVDGSVEVTVGATDEPSSIKAKQQQER